MKTNRQKGFTLIEILVAMFIFALVVPTIYGAYRTTVRISSDSEYSQETLSIGRSAISRVIKDLESICMYNNEYQFKLAPAGGGVDQAAPSLTFTSSAHINFSGQENALGVAFINYSVEKGDEGGFTLMRKDTLVQGKGSDTADQFAVCERIKSISLKFYDSQGKEYNTWDSGSDIDAQKKKAPSAVLIDLQLLESPEAGLSEKASPYRFVTRIKIGAA